MPERITIVTNLLPSHRKISCFLILNKSTHIIHLNSEAQMALPTSLQTQGEKVRQIIFTENRSFLCGSSIWSNELSVDAIISNEYFLNVFVIIRIWWKMLTPHFLLKNTTNEVFWEAYIKLEINASSFLQKISNVFKYCIVYYHHYTLVWFKSKTNFSEFLLTQI
jgi:hypothetical protein